MFLVLVLFVILLIITIDYCLGNKISYVIFERICNILFNKKLTDVNQSLVDNEKKETEVATSTFGAKHIEISNKEYYGKATLELARMAQKKLEESENDKIGDDNV